MDTELQESLETCLVTAREMDVALPEKLFGENLADAAVLARLDWIKRQLSTLTVKLTALQEDAEAGLSLNEMGFADPQEMQDLLDDMSIQIAQLKSMALSLGKPLGLGL